MDEKINWLQEIYSERWTAQFRKYCASKFALFTDPGQIMEDARQKMALSLQRRMDRGVDKPLTDGYIMVAFRNAVTDIHREASGRAEPRSWLKAFGRFGTLLFELYCLARNRREDVIGRLQSEPEVRNGALTPHKINDIMNEMDARKECEGKGHREESIFNEAGETQDVEDKANPEQELIEEQSNALQAYLFRSEPGDYQAIQHLVNAIHNAQQKLPKHLEIDDDQRFILHATLSQQLTESQMGDLLGGLTVRQVRYKRQKAIEALGSLLKSLNLSLEDLLTPASTVGEQAHTVNISGKGQE